MNPPQLDAWLMDARTLVVHGEFEKAKSILLEATQTYPACAEAWKQLGVAENKLGNHRAAERDLRQSLQIDESDADAWSSLGGVHVALARYEDALKSFEKGLTIGSPTTYALLNYLTMAAIAGDYESSLRRYASVLSEGQRECEAQIDRGANIPWCYYDLAQILFFEERGDFRDLIREALRRSNEWQAASARRTYELLAKSRRFLNSANEMLAEFARQEGVRRDSAAQAD
jgi:tetratricopeptide (TPR) repeat protein